MSTGQFPVSPEFVINEYYGLLAAQTAETVRYKGMLASAVAQRDAAVRRAAELEEQLRGWQSAETKASHSGETSGI